VEAAVIEGINLLNVCSAIIEHTNQVIYLEDNDVASISEGVLTVRHICFNSADQPQSTVHEITTLRMQIQQIMKGNSGRLVGRLPTLCDFREIKHHRRIFAGKSVVTKYVRLFDNQGNIT